MGTRPLNTAYGEFTLNAIKDIATQDVHLALVMGRWTGHDKVLARVHEALSVLDVLETARHMHFWSLAAIMKRVALESKGVAVLLNCTESAEQLHAQFYGTARASHGPEKGRLDLRSYGIGAQSLRKCGVHKMTLIGNPRRMPSLTGYGLEIAGYLMN